MNSRRPGRNPSLRFFCARYTGHRVEDNCGSDSGGDRSHGSFSAPAVIMPREYGELGIHIPITVCRHQIRLITRPEAAFARHQITSNVEVLDKHFFSLLEPL